MWENISKPVLFHNAAVLSQNEKVIRLEIAAHSVLSSLCDGIPSTYRNRSDSKSFLIALGKLSSYEKIRQKINWGKLYTKVNQDLPGYPYQQSLTYEYPQDFKEQVLFPTHGVLLRRKI